MHGKFVLIGLSVIIALALRAMASDIKSFPWAVAPCNATKIFPDCKVRVSIETADMVVLRLSILLGIPEVIFKI